MGDDIDIKQWLRNVHRWFKAQGYIRCGEAADNIATLEKHLAEQQPELGRLRGSNIVAERIDRLWEKHHVWLFRDSNDGLIKVINNSSWLRLYLTYTGRWDECRGMGVGFGTTLAALEAAERAVKEEKS